MGVRYHCFGFIDFGKLDRRKAYRSGTDHQYFVFFPDIRLLDGMESGAQCFDQCRLFKAELIRFVEESGRQNTEFPYPTIFMDAKHGKVFSTVGFAAPDILVLRAVEIRFHGAPVPDFQIRDTGSNFQNFYAGFMCQNPRISKNTDVCL